MSYRPLVLVSGPPATRSGYGAHTRDLIWALIGMDKFDIHINSLRWGNTPMNALNEKDPKYTFKLVYQMNSPPLVNTISE